MMLNVGTIIYDFILMELYGYWLLLFTFHIIFIGLNENVKFTNIKQNTAFLTEQFSISGTSPQVIR